MMQLTTEQRVFLVKSYFETQSFVEVQRLFALRFPNRNPPHKNVQKYLNRGTSLNRNSSSCGRKRTGRSQENIDVVQEELINNPDSISCRRNNSGLPSATFNRIVRVDLKWHPYKIQRRHQLLPGDFQRRLQFCEWLVPSKKSGSSISTESDNRRRGWVLDERASVESKCPKIRTKGRKSRFYVRSEC